MAMVALHAAKQLADRCLEVRVATRAPPPARRTKISHRRIAEAALRSVGRGHRQLLLQKLPKRVFRRSNCGLHATLCCTLLTQVQLADGIVLHTRQLDDRVALLA